MYLLLLYFFPTARLLSRRLYNDCLLFSHDHVNIYPVYVSYVFCVQAKLLLLKHLFKFTFLFELKIYNIILWTMLYLCVDKTTKSTVLYNTCAFVSRFACHLWTILSISVHDHFVIYWHNNKISYSTLCKLQFLELLVFHYHYYYCY